uniref:Uncharacterized protein n=1 Tax=Bombyx mori TaxID=7091 RepID=A0A8R2QYS8_BOMMO|nr:uncharacterized protein LOC110385513 [Bombyx mori]
MTDRHVLIVRMTFAIQTLLLLTLLNFIGNLFFLYSRDFVGENRRISTRTAGGDRHQNAMLCKECKNSRRYSIIISMFLKTASECFYEIAAQHDSSLIVAANYLPDPDNGATNRHRFAYRYSSLSYSPDLFSGSQFRSRFSEVLLLRAGVSS